MRPETAGSPSRRRRLSPRASVLLGVWVAVAAAAYLLVSPPPEAPSVDPEDQAIRDRMAAWAVRDAEEWTSSEGDLTLPWAEADGHLAIVIDDVGRELDLFDKLLALRFSLTYAVLPGSIYATGAQQRLAADSRRPREVLLHVPMEPLDPKAMAGLEADQEFLLASDSPAQLRAKVEAAIARVPAATGVNNHMGSRLTSDREAMATVMTVLREHGLYFLDSRTHPNTVAALEAERAGIPATSRKVFLDHEPGRAAIRSALAEAASYARTEPTVAIAHPSVELVEVLAEELPRLHDRGVAIYPLSRILAGR